MSVAEIDLFLNEFRELIEGEKGEPFSLLNDATEKSFLDLAAVRKLSVGMRELLALGNVNRAAVVRPQGDYQNEIADKNPDRFSIFKSAKEAEEWLRG